MLNLYVALTTVISLLGTFPITLKSGFSNTFGRLEYWIKTVKMSENNSFKNVDIYKLVEHYFFHSECYCRIIFTDGASFAS